MNEIFCLDWKYKYCQKFSQICRINHVNGKKVYEVDLGKTIKFKKNDLFVRICKFDYSFKRSAHYYYHINSGNIVAIFEESMKKYE